MPFPSGTYLGELVGRFRDEFENLYAQFEGWLRTEHKSDGSHSALTADSITTTGAVTADGAGTFDGNVTADADGKPVEIGALDGNTGAGMDAKASASSWWEVLTDPAHSVGSLTFRDMANQTVATRMLAIWRDTAIAASPATYSLKPGSALVLWKFGNNALGERISEVNAVTLNVSGTATVTGTLATVSYHEMTEIADPAAPAANKARVYTRDNGAGKTQLVVVFPTGAVQVLATEP